MLICEKCNKLYEEDELPKHIEHHPYGDGTADEVFTDMECPCGGDIVEAVQCDRCGEYLPETETDYIHGYNSIVCEDCYEELYDPKKIINIKRRHHDTDKIFINVFLAEVFCEAEINAILFREIQDSLTDISMLDRIKNYADYYKDFYAEKLFKLERLKKNENNS